VLAVEPHPVRAARLRARFAGQPVSVLEISAEAVRLPARPFRVVASPPFAISTAVVRQLLAPHSRLVSADLVLQRAAVRRFVLEAWRWGRRWSVTEGTRVPRHAFQPPPQVDAEVLVVRRAARG
jgi:23S rRNA (adenine-N6)-dimethyltransferase